MENPISFGFELLQSYVAGYVFGFAFLVTCAWLFTSLCAYVFFG